MEISRKQSIDHNINNNIILLSKLCHVVYATKGFTDSVVHHKDVSASEIDGVVFGSFLKSIPFMVQSKLFMDSRMVPADASNYSVVNKQSLKRYLNKSYQILESRLEQEQQSGNNDQTIKSGAENKKYIST